MAPIKPIPTDSFAESVSRAIHDAMDRGDLIITAANIAYRASPYIDPDTGPWGGSVYVSSVTLKQKVYRMPR